MPETCSPPESRPPAVVPPLARILLVEDDEDMRVVSRTVLETLGGFTVRAIASGAEALAAAAEFAPDLILLDVMMPELDGPETLRRLRADPRTAAVPVVFLTARVQRRDLAGYRELGALGVLPKPFDPLRLCPTIHQLWSDFHDCRTT